MIKYRSFDFQKTNIGLQFLASGLLISHEICWISGEIQQISGEILPEPYKFRCFNKNYSVDECRRGAMTLDFMKSGVIAPSMHPPPN